MLDYQVIEESRGTVLKLSGQLDTDTAPELSSTISGFQHNPPEVLILDLANLDYISSAGLRCVFQLKKLMQNTGGRFVIREPSPQVQKVFDIVKAVPVKSVFSSAEELDAYLDAMQKKVSDDNDYL